MRLVLIVLLVISALTGCVNSPEPQSAPRPMPSIGKLTEPLPPAKLVPMKKAEADPTFYSPFRAHVQVLLSCEDGQPKSRIEYLSIFRPKLTLSVKMGRAFHGSKSTVSCFFTIDASGATRFVMGSYEPTEESWSGVTGTDRMPVVAHSVNTWDKWGFVAFQWPGVGGSQPLPHATKSNMYAPFPLPTTI